MIRMMSYFVQSSRTACMYSCVAEIEQQLPRIGSIISVPISLCFFFKRSSNASASLKGTSETKSLVIPGTPALDDVISGSPFSGSHSSISISQSAASQTP